MPIQITWIPEGAGPLAFAAGELERYLNKMLPDAALRIALSAEGPDITPERFSVHMTAEGGTIAGSGPRAVLLGVYDYLRRLGCRFLGAGKAWELVPAINRERLEADYEREASFRHRGVCIEGADSLENILDFIDWLPKAGYNSFFLQFKLPYAFLARWYHHEGNPLRTPENYTISDAARDMERLEAAVKKRGLLLHQVGHGWTGEVLGYEAVSWKPDGRPLEEARRPMAAQVDGVRELRRGVPANTNLCYHSAQAVDAFASLVTDYARNHPAADYLHIWLADEYNSVCECEDCVKTTVSDQYVALLNEIDRRLTAEGLATRLVFLLYQELLWPPVRERLKNPDRFVLMFAPISRTFASSYCLDGGPRKIPPFVRNRITLPTDLGENLAFLRGWQEIFSGDSFVYDYPLGRAHYGDLGYVHIAQVIGSDIKKLRQLGLDGYISCQELRCALPNALPNYVMGYTLFDEGADTEELMEEYFAAAYGERAGAVRAYLGTLSRLSSCDYVNGKGRRTNPDMAERMEKALETVRAFQPETQGAETLPWKLLAYHGQYALHLAEALRRLAAGDRAGGREAWLALRDLITENERDFQPYLDVYRVLEVTEKYTGFGA